MRVNLTANAITAIINGDINAKPLVQVLNINFDDTTQCYDLLISDGVLTHRALLASQLHERVTTGQVIAGSVVQLIDYDTSFGKIIVVAKMETIIRECEIIGNPPEPDSAGQKQRNKLKLRIRFSFDEKKQEEEGRKKKQEEEGQEEEERKKKQEEEEEEERKKKQEEEEERMKQEEEMGLLVWEMMDGFLEEAEEKKMDVMEMLGMVDEERKQEQEEQRMKEEEEEEKKEEAEDWIMETLSEVDQSRCQICLNVEGGDDWVQCDSCDGWVHTCCAGVTMDYAKYIKEFICPRCENMAGLL